MKKYPTLLLVLVSLVFVFSLTACGGAANKDQSLVVGVTPGPHAEIMEVVKKVADKNGLKIKIVEFSDYIQPNVALHQGEIDVNVFQHKPYMDNVVKERKYDLVFVANTVIFPMGLYSQKIKNIDELPMGSTVGIPNDPTNGSRALLLLEKNKVIKLKEGVGVQATPKDIIENPKSIKIKELDAAFIIRSLSDLQLAAINTNYAITVGLNPSKDSLSREDAQSPYTNIMVSRNKDKDSPLVKELLKAYYSPEVKKFINDKYGDSIVSAW